MRECWDGLERLRNAGKTSPDIATGAHVSMISHITKFDVDGALNQQDIGNGFANRILWVASRRSENRISIPRRIEWERDSDIVPRLKACIETATEISREFDYSSAGRTAWDKFYLGNREFPGLVGKMTARTEAHVLRLATIYSALDRKAIIEPCHIEAASAFVEYCNRTVQWLFSATTGNKKADLVLWALRNSPKGMSRTAINSEVFSRNSSSTEISSILTTLRESGYVGVHETGRFSASGKAEEAWYAVEHKEAATRKGVRVKAPEGK